MTQKVKGWPLPEVVDPPKIDICISIPNDRFHIANFLGQLIQLGFQFNWQRDSAHTALAASKVWYQVYLKVVEDIQNGNYCIKIPPANGMEIEDDMPIRVDCDCNVYVPCCDGTEVQLVTTKMQSGSQPGQGAPQPQPGGGTADYSGCMDANKVYLVAAPVSTGDLITLQETTGSWNDPDESQFLWRCPSGEIFFAGDCQGSNTYTFKATDPLPGTPHMAIIANVGGTYYPFTAGVLTVPGGISNATVLLQANDSNRANDQGNVCFKVQVKNNQAVTWSHQFYAGKGPGVFSTTHGDYDGVRDRTVDTYPDSSSEFESQIDCTIAPTNITRVMVTRIHNVPVGSFGSRITFSGGGTWATAGGEVGTFVQDTGQISATAVTTIEINSVVADINDSGILKVIIEGYGPDPF